MTPTTLDAVEARAAAAGSAGKRAFVRRMFSEIAPRYDLLNHVLSFNVDRRWRRAAIGELGPTARAGETFLDLCAGTLDVGAELSRRPGFAGLVLGADFAEPMLRRGSGKAPRGVLAPVVADALALPLPNDSAAGAIVAFGVRNLADLDEGLREVHRVLAPGGRFVILEFSTPRSRVVRAGYHAYFHHVLPTLGRLLSGHATAYRYLPDSVARFPEADALAERMRLARFTNVRWRPLTFGVAAIHVGEKPAVRPPA
jgi:demethylmenaquinone methyltransferase/2-methoxy-6-polyprenyl-1,4-benzoquinol methylase